MKKKLQLAFALTLILAFVASSDARAGTPYNTWTAGPGGWMTQTQDAYTPYAEMTLPVSAPEDMFVSADGTIYVADTGNGQIVQLHNFEVAAVYGTGVLQSPSGVFVDDVGNIYVADSASNTVVIFDAQGNLVTQFGRPAEPLFGLNAEFLPRKIAVDARQNIYIVSEGSVNGLIQMNTNGNFIGYFGANPASMSIKMILQRLLLTDAQLAKLVRNEAASPSNLAIDDQAMLYTVTAGTTRTKAIRKFTVSGKNIFPDAWGSVSFRDIHVSADGLVIAVDANGLMYEYDSTGELLFVFGAKDTGDQRLGTLMNPTAIERYGDFLYVLDKDKNAIIVYKATTFAQEVHTGIRLYMGGYYREAMPYFEDVLNYNGSFILSYQAIADAYFKADDYQDALTSYRYAEDRDGYSQAFWELRNRVLQKYLSQALLSLVGLWIVAGIGTRLEKRRKWFDPARNWFRGLQRFKLVDDFVFMFRFIKQPVDSFYYIKKKQRGSLLFAGLVYAWVIVVRVLSLYVTGFVFNPYSSLSYIPVGNVIVYTALLLVLWNAANYLISTISDGEGRVRDVVIGSAYSLFPYVLFALPIALLSNVLTSNEYFLYTFPMQLMYFWVGLMLFLMVKEIHNYSFGETVRNILLTLFTMALFVLTGYILYVLFNQLYDFIMAILREVGLRG